MAGHAAVAHIWWPPSGAQMMVHAPRPPKRKAGLGWFPRSRLLAHLYGPAARCKPKMLIWRSWSCASVSGLLMELELLAIMDIRARSISFATRPRRPDGPPDHERAGETFLHLLFPTRRPRRESQPWLSDSLEPSAIPLVNLSVFISGCCLHDACFIVALLCQHGPGDTRQLVGKSCGQNVTVQALSSASEPDPEAVLWPARRPQQNDPSCLHEECA